MFVCSCFGITEEHVREHASSGACTPRQIASECKAGTDCGSCVRRIQALLGRGAGCPRGAAAVVETAATPAQPAAPVEPAPVEAAAA